MNIRTQKRGVGRPRALTPEQEQEVFERRLEGVSFEKLARHYNVGVGTIVRVMERAAMRDVA